MLGMKTLFPFFPTDWVDVANDLLSKCHTKLKLRRLADCDANVFIALYENILGEEVPGKIKRQICQMSTQWVDQSISRVKKSSVQRL